MGDACGQDLLRSGAAVLNSSFQERLGEEEQVS